MRDADPKAEHASREHVQYQHTPVAPQQDRFTAEQVHAPESVLEVSDECEPRWAMGTAVPWPVVHRERAAHDIFVNVHPEGMRDLLRYAHTAELGIAALQFHDRRDEFHRRAFGTGFSATGRGGK